MGSSGSTGHDHYPVRGRLEKDHEHHEPDDKFSGEDSNSTPPYFFMLPRCYSVEIENDPRVFNANVIGRRFAAFSSVSVGATLVASLSLTTAAGVETMPKSWASFTALILMLMVFAMNIFTVLVITQQYYQIHRLQTCSANGFDIARSYYMNHNIVALRHAAVKCFFWSLAIYVFAVGAAAFAKMHVDKPITAYITITALVLVGIFLSLVMRKQRLIFDDKHKCIELFKEPLKKHIKKISEETAYSADRKRSFLFT